MKNKIRYYKKYKIYKETYRKYTADAPELISR